MNQPEDNQPIGAVWRRVRDLAPEYHSLEHDGARTAAVRWKTVRAQLENRDIDRSSMEIWLREQRRAFAIETGQIEGLYLLHRGVIETLITEGFENVRGAHSVGPIGDETLKGLLMDQEAALEMLFAHVKDERPLTASAIKEWHALLTRHQESATGMDHFGRRVEIPLRKGEWKIRPNNPRRQDGFVHQYCPPEQVQSEIDRFLDFHARHRALDLAPETEAAWLHHEFVRIHPFQDGNGRISRLLMAHAYAKAGEFPPIIPAQNKLAYIEALEAADEGAFPELVRYFGDLAAPRSNEAALRAEGILRGRTHYRHGNGGVTREGEYHPPIASRPLAEGIPSLITAAETGDLAAMRQLIAAGTNVNQVNPKGWAPLHFVAYYDSPELVQVLLDSGAEVDLRCGPYGSTPLHLAARQGRTESVRILLDAGADIHAVTGTGDLSALHLAAPWGSVETVQLLIQHGAELNAVSDRGATALHQAAQGTEPMATAAIVAALLDAGADATIRNTRGQTAYDCACTNPDFPETGILDRLREAARSVKAVKPEPEESGTSFSL